MKEMMNREAALGRDVTMLEQQVTAAQIVTDDDYSGACELAGKIKGLNAAVVEYWEPLRASAYSAYRAVLDKKSQMLDPLTRAETALKDKMGSFLRLKEEKRKAEEAKLKAALQAEKDRKMAEAKELHEAGDLMGAEYAMLEADVLEGAALNTVVRAEPPKVKGIGTRRNWKIRSIDPAKVPVTLNGAELRPVDQKAVMRLIRASKGTIQIPGVEYEETVTVAVSSRP